ncbi:MAG: lycopene cyclase domain-containing protein [Cytophagales bacterium]|nr:lycopene cyclase domain-containing protein [Cytophagales bacterium]
MSLYFLLHFCTISFPLARSFEYRVKYYTKWAPLVLAILITGFVFIVWDILFTKSGVWGFNPAYLSGFYLANLPIEEWLFFVTVPFASVFIYENVIYFIRKPLKSAIAQRIMLVMGITLVLIAITHYDQLYTFYCFLGTGILLILHGTYIKAEYAGHFLITYLFHLIPFFVVNGILTGSFIDGQIVWYNPAEHFGILLMTIPIEDSIYSMFLLLMNITLYEYFKKTRFS